MSILDTFDLTGRTALVTGGYRGLGLAFATGLAEAGAELVIGARDGDVPHPVVAARATAGPDNHI